MSQITPHLCGGLGNQMFQYAAARALALRTGASLALDVSWFAEVADRQFALAPFHIAARPLQSNLSASWLPKRLAALLARVSGKRVYREPAFTHDPEFAGLTPPCALHGYFQSEKYFADYRAEIAADFMLRAAPSAAAADMLLSMENCDAICVHVRRGDYVANPETNAFHGTCSPAYYEQALSMLLPALSRPHCFVFSDDPPWVRENMRFPVPMTVVDLHGPEAAHEDLRLMVACRDFIIANSSLSWWGAWLGRHAAKRVVAPKRWFNSATMDTRDLIPASWLRV